MPAVTALRTNFNPMQTSSIITITSEGTNLNVSYKFDPPIDKPQDIKSATADQFACLIAIKAIDDWCKSGNATQEPSQN